MDQDLEVFLSLLQEEGKPKMEISPEAHRALLEYNWPGNVRELEHALERACLFAEEHSIGLEDLTSEIVGLSSGKNALERTGKRLNLKDAVKGFEQEYIGKVIDEVGGDKKLAAEILEIDLSTLYRKSK